MFDFIKSLVLDNKDELIGLIGFFVVTGYVALGVFGGFCLLMYYLDGNKTKEDVVHACGFFVLWPLFLFAFLFKATIIGISDLVDYIFNVFKSLIFEDEMDGDNSDYSLRHTTEN